MYYSNGLGLDRGTVSIHVLGVLSCIWSFEKWSTSRWLGVGKVAKSVVCSHLLGLGHLCAHALRCGASEFYLKGSMRAIDEPVCMQMFIAGLLISFPLGAALDDIMKDDRMMNVGRIPSMLDLFLAEREYIGRLDVSVWHRFAKLGHWGGALDCRSSIMRALVCAYCCLEHAVVPYSQTPMSYAADPARAVSCLMHLDRQSVVNDGATLQLWRFLKLFPGRRQEVVDCLRCLHHVRCSNNNVEQGRAAQSLLVKFHKDKLRLPLLVTRGFLAMIRSRISVNPLEERIKNCEEMLDKLRRKKPQRATLYHTLNGKYQSMSAARLLVARRGGSRGCTGKPHDTTSTILTQSS